VLLGVLRTVQDFPADDVTLPVLDAALEAVAHIVMNTRENQQYIRLKGGIEPLYLALHYVVRHLPRAEPEPEPEAEPTSPSDSPATTSPTDSPASARPAPGGGPGGGGVTGRARPASASARRAPVRPASASVRAPAYRAPPTFDAANGVAAPAAASARVPAHRRSASGGPPPPPAAAATAAAAGSTAPSRPARPQSAASRPPPTVATAAAAATASRDAAGDGVAASSLQRDAARGAGYHPLFKLTETACLALSNVVFHCPENQLAALELGVLEPCLRLLQRPSCGANRAVQVAALNLLINLADTNQAAQRALATDEAAETTYQLMCAPGSERVVSSACLLVSHAAWNCRDNQLRFGSERAVRQHPHP